MEILVFIMGILLTLSFNILPTISKPTGYDLALRHNTTQLLKDRDASAASVDPPAYNAYGYALMCSPDSKHGKAPQGDCSVNANDGTGRAFYTNQVVTQRVCQDHCWCDCLGNVRCLPFYMCDATQVAKICWRKGPVSGGHCWCAFSFMNQMAYWFAPPISNLYGNGNIMPFPYGDLTSGPSGKVVKNRNFTGNYSILGEIDPPNWLQKMVDRASAGPNKTTKAKAEKTGAGGSRPKASQLHGSPSHVPCPDGTKGCTVSNILMGCKCDGPPDKTCPYWDDAAHQCPKPPRGS